jgi:hypothetical protein
MHTTERIERNKKLTIPEGQRIIIMVYAILKPLKCCKIQAEYHIGRNPLSGFVPKMGISETGSHFIFKINGEPNMMRLLR